ncbi:sarcosine oxidase subunit alpha, partial [Candidatus Acetothermia bacterium]
MRLVEHPILQFQRGRRVMFTFDGEPVEAYEGETIAAALHAAGIRILSRTRSGAPRGLFCAIGKCSSCLMTVDGTPNVKSCVTPVRDGMVVESQTGPGRLNPDFRPQRAPARTLGAQVAIVGGGPAGLSAAQTLLEHGVRPVLVDENPHPGGQLVKQTHKFFGSRAERAGTRGVTIARELISRVRDEVELLSQAQALGLYEDGSGRTLVVAHGRRLTLIRSPYLIAATGAEERFL